MPLFEFLTGVKEAYEQYASGNNDHPEPSIFIAPSSGGTWSRQSHRWIILISATVVLLILLPRLAFKAYQRLPTAAAAAEGAAQTCPTGAPQVAVTAVQLLPDPDLDPPSALYMVSGVITNSTTAAISVSGIGFYFGGADPLRPPDWTNALDNMDVSGDPTQIPAGSAIQWRDKQIEILDQPAGTNVTAALSYPDAYDSNTSFQWSWPDAGINCPGPNAFDN